MITFIIITGRREHWVSLDLRNMDLFLDPNKLWTITPFYGTRERCIACGLCGFFVFFF